VLTAYLSTLPLSPAEGTTALDLGAGIGLTSLALAALGWDVTATDVAEVVDGVLAGNCERNEAAVRGRVTVQVLDWFSSGQQRQQGAGEQAQGEEKKYGMIVTTDTLYEPSLVRPLLTTIRKYAGAATTVWVALEVRDKAVIEAALEMAKEMGIVLSRIPRTRLRKALKAAGMAWKEEEWEGVEVWKGKIKM
jgi:predicted nicotinamide N-methyase